MLEFLNKKPSNRKEWKQEIESLQVATGFFGELIRENVRDGVLLALNDAFGEKK